LKDRPVAGDSKGADGRRLDDRAEGLPVVHALFLGESS
jgi:hypothetical protein